MLGLRRPRARGLLLAAAGLLAGAGLPLVSVLSAQAATGFATTVVNQAAGRCAGVPNSATTAGQQLRQAACSAAANQSFTFTATATAGTYTIAPLTAGDCLDISGVSTADNAAVIQWPCNGQANQQFRLSAVSVSGVTNTFNLIAVQSGKCVAPAAGSANLVQLTCGSTGVWRLPGYSAGSPADSYQGLPSLDPNGCHNSSLPRAYGTNFTTPNDPYGQGYYNTTAIGWDGNYWPVFEYLSGSFFARGVNSTYNASGTTICGAMYSFSAYTYGGNPAAQSVQWTQDSGYLPAMKTTRAAGSVAIAIKDFADQVTIGGQAFLLVYTRVSVTNNGTAAVSVPPGGSGPNLIRLTSTTLDTVQPGQTNNHDFVVAVDNFGTGAALPTGTALSGSAPGYDAAYTQMATYWNGRVGETNTFSLPNLTLPNTGSLANPGTAMADAYRAGTIYNLIMQIGQAQFSAANNYNWILNHDVPGELTAKFETGDFHDARNLLLTARISEQTNWNEVGANWYWDGVWKTMGAWATYLAKTNDTTFVNQFFHDDASAASPWGPSLYTIARTRYPSQLAADGTLATNFDNDSTGRWLFSNFSALQMLAAYKYIASRLDLTTEAAWADTAYTSLLNSLNTVVGRNQSTNGFSYLPCEVDKPNSANRCNTFNDANWASPAWVGQNQWSTMLSGGALTGIMGDPGQIDRMYAWGFARLSANGLPYPTFGAFNGYSTAYNTAYGSDGLFSNNYRDLPITSYAWQIQTTTGGPNAWWEANGSGPSTGNPWQGSHAGPQFGACPYAWPTSAQQQGLLESLVAEGLAGTGRAGSYTFTRPLYIGRGLPNTWVAAGQTATVGNLTNAYDVASGSRTTYAVSLAVTRPASTRLVTVTLTGTPPGGAVYVQLPIFLTVAVNAVTGGSYNATTHTVTFDAGSSSAAITLAN